MWFKCNAKNVLNKLCVFNQISSTAVSRYFFNTLSFRRNSFSVISKYNIFLQIRSHYYQIIDKSNTTYFYFLFLQNFMHKIRTKDDNLKWLKIVGREIFLYDLFLKDELKYNYHSLNIIYQSSYSKLVSKFSMIELIQFWL